MNKKEFGFYTIEGAFAITIFTGLFMILLSLISIIRVETVIQSAINQTAMLLSQYSYAIMQVQEKVDTTSDLQAVNVMSAGNDISNSILEVIKETRSEVAGYTGGALLCKSITRNNFNDSDYDSWLISQGISGGYDGLSFALSNVLGDGETITVSVIYKLQVNTFGLYDKQITVCQRAQTRAWLPLGADESFFPSEIEDETSIWDENSFVRGKYFVEKLKNSEPNAAVESGYGIDLYYKSERIIAEIFSMNVFSSSYSQCKATDQAEIKLISSYTPDTECITKQLLRYGKDFNLDILKTERLIEMADGSLGNFGRLNEKRLILIVPLEAKYSASYKRCFDSAAKELEDEGITLVVKYMEGALV